MSQLGERPVNVGDLVRQARNERGYSVRQLAGLVGVSAGTISAIENGHTAVTVDRLASIASALDAELGSLLHRDNRPQRPQRPQHPGNREWRSFGRLDLGPVLRAAVEEFTAAGYHGTSMRAVADRAGLSVPGLYHHCASKQELLVRILDVTLDELEWRLAGAAAAAATPLDGVALFTEALALYHTMRPDLAFLAATEMRSLEQPDAGRIAARRRALQHQLDAQVDAAISAGLAATPAPRETARAIVSMCSALPQWFDPDGPMSPGDVAALHARLALDMIRPSPSTQQVEQVEKAGT